MFASFVGKMKSSTCRGHNFWPVAQKSEPFTPLERRTEDQFLVGKDWTKVERRQRSKMKKVGHMKRNRFLILCSYQRHDSTQMPWDFWSKKQEELKFTKVIDYKEGVNHQKGVWSVYKKWSKTPSEQNPETVFKIENFYFLANWAFEVRNYAGPQVRSSAGLQLHRYAGP